MKLKLCNFRCHNNAEYTFPDFGLILIAGNSGSGKSTLLKAILYALYGSKALRKPYSFGTTTCSVTLEFMGLTIKRSNRPNRLVVNDRLEDDAAQAFINERLGLGYDEFMISSYIPQKNNNSILSLSQTEQLRLIKTLAFNHDKNETHKNHLKETIRNSSDILVEKRSQVQFIQQEIDNINDTVAVVEFPLTTKDHQTPEEAITEYKERLQSYNFRIQQLYEEKSFLNKQLQTQVELELAKEKLAQVNSKLGTLQKRQGQLQTLIQELPQGLEHKLELLVGSIRYLKLEEKTVYLETQYSHIRDDELEDLKTRKIELERGLWKHCGCSKSRTTATDELQKLQEQQVLWEQYQTAKNALEALCRELKLTNGSSKEDLIEQYTKKISNLDQEYIQLCTEKERLLLEREIIACPKCQTSLRWKDSKLVLAQIQPLAGGCNYDTDLQTVNERLDQLKNSKTKYEEISQRLHSIVFPEHHGEDHRQQITFLKQYITQHEQHEDELKSIEHKLADDYQSAALKRIQRDLDKHRRLREKLSKRITEPPTESVENLQQKQHALVDRIENYKKRLEESRQLKLEISNLTQKSEKFAIQVNNLESKVNIEEINETLGSLDIKLANIKQKQHRDEALSEQVEHYSKYLKLQEELKRWEEKLTIANKKLKTAEKIHSANLRLKDKYVQAEILALETTINSVNEHTRYYLETFFADNQLSAVLESTQRGKGFKIDTMITYKGNEYDNINQLSGGEFDRCTLASICGINSMLGSRILILDESLSALDSATNTELLRFLSGLAQDKLILVCSHEAIRGIFNEIIEM